LGVNLFDTAAAYSDSEAILGRALRGVARDRYLIATKFTLTTQGDAGGPVISPNKMIESCEQSLQRLNIETIDVFQFHGALPENYRECVEQLFPTAQKLQQQGKVRFLGVTEYFYKDPAHQMLEAALTDDIWDTIMVKYGILNMIAAAKVLPMAKERNVGVLNMSAVRAKLSRPKELEGIIARWKAAGLIDANTLPDQDPLGFLVHGGVPSVVAAGYKFGIAPAAISTLLIGTGDVSHLEENVATLLGPPLPDEDMQRLHAMFGTIAETESDPE